MTQLKECAGGPKELEREVFPLDSPVEPDESKGMRLEARERYIGAVRMTFRAKA
jgi:hypothetical protein